MLDKNKIYAIIGATNNKQKYGYKVLKDLKEAGYKLIPINLKEKKILGLKTYKKISAVASKIDVAVFVVPPAVTEKILFEAEKMGIKKIWLQPGSESAKAIQFCHNKGMECIYNACVIIKNKDIF